MNLFKKKREFEDLDLYEEDEYEIPENIETFEEPQIVKNIDLESEEYSEKDNNDEYFDNPTNKIKHKSKTKLFINVFFTIIILIIVMISVDVVCVSKYNIGPFFAIKTKSYKDGGSKEYIGLGYKVIKYKQIQGRRDTELGTFKLKYNVESIDINDEDLAIEFENYKEETAKRYYKKFVKLESTVKKIDKNNNRLILEFTDEDSKYTLRIYCKMADKDNNLDVFSTGDKVSVLGTISRFEVKNNKSPNKVYLNNTFAESLELIETVEIDE